MPCSWLGSLLSFFCSDTANMCVGRWMSRFRGQKRQIGRGFHPVWLCCGVQALRDLQDQLQGFTRAQVLQAAEGLDFQVRMPDACLLVMTSAAVLGLPACWVLLKHSAVLQQKQVQL